ncbi:MAG: GIY-YIG nuclease family protein [Luteimonas sp.]
MRNRLPCTYMLASAPRGTLYIGVTSDLVQRVWQHRKHRTPRFTSRHHIHQLVWFETHDTMDAAITREKRLKAWQRLWKVQLVESTNPDWHDLYPRLI